MKGHLYQLIDSDGENAGLLYSDYKYDDTFIESRWNEYLDTHDDNGVDEFVEWFNTVRRPPIERVYVNEIFQKNKMKDIYIKDEGDFVTVIAMTDKAKSVFKEQKIEGEKFDCELSDAHSVLIMAVTNDLIVDTEVPIRVPNK